MRLHKHRRENATSLSLDVRKIEVTRPTRALEEMGVYETYHRTFRFTLNGGGVLEVSCKAYFEGEIQLRSVKKLPAVQAPINLATGDWLTPKVYTPTKK